MRTTLRINDRLLAEVKKLAVETGRTFTDVVEDALRIMLQQRKEPERHKPVKLRTCGGNGLQPGVDLSSNATLAELMDQHDGYVGR